MPCYRTTFQGVIHWPHLDFGNLGVEKQFVGIDLVATAPEGVNVIIGYDQRDLAARTADFLLDEDTLPAQMVPIQRQAHGDRPRSSRASSVRPTFARKAAQSAAARMAVSAARSPRS